MEDIEKTKHYTTNSHIICDNLLKYIPNDVILVEPFVGDGDLLSLFPNHTWEKYDIEKKNDNIVQDTLINKVDVKNKWVITNPPYLARNKASDKTVFDLYNVDDLYKAAILSILDCEGGILIIPTNFFTDERSYSIREQFLSTFSVKEVNVFTKPIFETTTYSICAFAFQRSNYNNDVQNIIFNIKPDNKAVLIELNKEYGYRIGGEEYSEILNSNNIFNRLLLEKNTNDYNTCIKLYAIDTRDKKIHLEYDENLFYGKNTDRTYATFVCSKELSKEEQLNLISRFNEYMESFRDKYSDLTMTNYRDYNRKRISFNFAYHLASYLLNE